MVFPDLLASADRAALGLLGGPIRYRSPIGDVVDVRGIFDAAYVKAPAGQLGISTQGPAIFLRESDLPWGADEEAGVFTIDGSDYTPHTTERDGMGGVVLHLHEAI